MRPSLRPRGSEQFGTLHAGVGVALSFPTSIAAPGGESGYDDAQSFALAPMVGGIGIHSRAAALSRHLRGLEGTALESGTRAPLAPSHTLRLSGFACF